MTAWIYEIAARPDRPERAEAALSAWLPGVIAAPAVAGCDVYRALAPEAGAKEPTPSHIVHLFFADEAAARAMLAGLKPPAEAGLNLGGEFMRVHEFPVAGRVAPLEARFSYVVRYFLPAQDPAGFRAYYMRMHPPILARFPGIRNVFCYEPAPLDRPPLPASGYLIGNEVVFDDRATFEAAMVSPVREEARADGQTFSPYSGRSPHWPMERTRLR